VALLFAALLGAQPASAGPYVENQCSSSAPSIASGWSAYGQLTIALTVLSNGCGSGGALGDLVSSNGQSGAVTENGSGGSNVGLSVSVPGSAPDVTIRAIKAHVIASAVTGNDAFLSFVAAGQALPGGTLLPIGAGPSYSADENWTLPQGARDFQAYVYCSTDMSSPTCHFADAGSVPALKDITLTLAESVAPNIGGVSGPLAAAALKGGAITGSQAVSFTTSDTDSGVRSAALTLTPTAGGAAHAISFDFSSKCAYDSWNACPLSETVSSASFNSAQLPDGAYSVVLSATDAAGNVGSDELGQIISHNAPSNTAAPTVLVPGAVAAGTPLTTQPGGWSAPSGAGTISYGYQWESCDAQGEHCQAIAGAQAASYTPTASDVGRALRLVVTASNADGAASAASALTSVVTGIALGPTEGGPQPTPDGPLLTGLGAPNGSPASEAAQLQLGVKAAISRPYGHGAFLASGRLLDAQGRAIGGATLDVLERALAGSGPRVLSHATTRSDGAFTVAVPEGASRTIEVAYRAFLQDAAYAARARVQETIGAGVLMRVSARHTSPTGTIKLSGVVHGQIPRGGVIVELLVHYQGQWVPFRTPQTDGEGRFHTRYQFHGAVGRFPFRAEVPSGQAGFSFGRGYSATVAVSTG